MGKERDYCAKIQFSSTSRSFFLSSYVGNENDTAHVLFMMLPEEEDEEEEEEIPPPLLRPHTSL